MNDYIEINKISIGNALRIDMNMFFSARLPSFLQIKTGKFCLRHYTFAINTNIIYTLANFKEYWGVSEWIREQFSLKNRISLLSL